MDSDKDRRPGGPRIVDKRSAHNTGGQSSERGSQPPQQDGTPGEIPKRQPERAVQTPSERPSTVEEVQMPPVSQPDTLPGSQTQARAAFDQALEEMASADWIANAAVTLVSVAIKKMGSGKHASLDEARMAIDAVRAMLDAVQGRLGPAESDLRDSLAQVQLAFVREIPASEGPAG